MLSMIWGGDTHSHKYFRIKLCARSARQHRLDIATLNRPCNKMIIRDIFSALNYMRVVVYPDNPIDTHGRIIIQIRSAVFRNKHELTLVGEAFDVVLNSICTVIRCAARNSL